jgi:hypothetical protein
VKRKTSWATERLPGGAVFHFGFSLPQYSCEAGCKRHDNREKDRGRRYTGTAVYLNTSIVSGTFLTRERQFKLFNIRQVMHNRYRAREHERAGDRAVA